MQFESDTVVRQTVRYASPLGQIFMAIFNWRWDGGFLAIDWNHETAAALFAGPLQAKMWQWLDQMPDTVIPIDCKLQIVYPVLGTDWLFTPSHDDWDEPLVRGLARDELVNEEIIEPMAASMELRSYRLGRPGVGHKYFGPLLARFVAEDGSLDIDPDGPGDLRELINVMLTPAVPAGVFGTGQFIPCIVPNKPEPGTVTAESDMRAAYFRAFPTFLHRRKVGLGI